MDQIRAVEIISYPIGASETFGWGVIEGGFCEPVHVKSVLLLPSLWLGKPYLQNNRKQSISHSGEYVCTHVCMCSNFRNIIKYIVLLTERKERQCEVYLILRWCPWGTPVWRA